MIHTFARMPRHQQGILCMLAGLMLLLFLNGVFRTVIAWLLGVSGIGLIVYGLMLLDGPHRIMKLFKKSKHHR